MRARLLLGAALLGLACSGGPREDAAASPSPTPSPTRSPLTAGPAVGSPIPPFELPDQQGRLQRFETLRGPQGLVLNFNRSVVW